MLKIKWLGQAGYLIYDEYTTICIDPYLSDVVNRVANRPRMYETPIEPQDLKADVVICTHNHLDHLDIDAIPKMNKKSMLFLAPKDCESKLRELGVENYNAFEENSEKQIGKFKLKGVFAKHTVPAVGIVVEYENQRLYFTSDSLFDEKLKHVKCEMLFICINGKLGNMNVNEAIEISKVISPKTAVPNHYDMFESNSENPLNFTNCINYGFIMEVNKEYKIKEGKLYE